MQTAGSNSCKKTKIQYLKLFETLQDNCERLLTRNGESLKGSQIRKAFWGDIQKAAADMVEWEADWRDQLNSGLALRNKGQLEGEESLRELEHLHVKDLLVLLSLTWGRYRQLINRASGWEGETPETLWVPPSSFVRSTKKYWVPLDRVTQLKAHILEHLPLLIFGRTQAEQEALLSPLNVPGRSAESQLVSSVYFDTWEANYYHRRITRQQGANLLRFRWYGDQTDENDIFIERKTHCESWVLESSAKERFSLPYKLVPAFMGGQLDFDQYFRKVRKFRKDALKSLLRLFTEVWQMFEDRQHPLVPMVRTSYYRTAFQESTNNRVRISLDTNLTLINEKGSVWRKDRDAPLPKYYFGDRAGIPDWVRFPFAILEIKLEVLDQTPSWILSALERAQAIEVPKFSKFQHGMSTIHPEICRLSPHWLAHFDSSGSRCNTHFVAEAPWKHPILDLPLVEPKVLLANERALLHYVQKVILLAILSLYLLMSPSGTRVAGVVAPLPLVFLVYSLFTFGNRQTWIQERTQKKTGFTRLDVPGLPIGLTTLSLITLLSVLGCLAYDGFV